MTKNFSHAQTATFAVLFVFAFTAFVFGQTTKNLQNDLENSFKKFSLVKFNNQTALQKAQTGNALTIATDARTYELNLQPRDLRSPRYRAEETGANGLLSVETDAAVTTFAGRVSGEENDSEARVSIDAARGIEGYFISKGEMFFIEPASRYSGAASVADAVVYRAEDALNQKGFVCDVEEKIERGERMLNAASDLQNPQTAPRVIEMATEADFEFVGALGGAAQANRETLNILNMVEGVYRNELNLTISVVYQHVWTTADPYPATTTNALLVSFRDYWNANFPASSIPRDAAHLFTGKTVFSGQGLAYLGVICRTPNAAYGLDGRLDFAPVKFELTAHEIGHNLGATHTDITQSCGGTIMNPLITQDTQLSFCAYSRNEITTYVSANNGCLSVQAIAAKTLFDFDGDKRADVSIYRPSEGNWYLQNSSAGFSGAHWGQNGDKPAAGDYDGDGRTDIAIFRSGVWYRLKSSTNTYDGVAFGLPDDLPVPADFDGDAKTDVAVFRPSDGSWYVQRSLDGAFQSARFGQRGDVPLPADYDADGKADYNLWRPTDGGWYRLNSGSSFSFTGARWGQNGDKPVAGDFDGDGKADLAVYRPAEGAWYLLKSADNSFAGVRFGLAGDIPVAADYDGDGKADIAVFRPSSGDWYRINSNGGAVASEHFGLNGDVPVPANQN